MVRNTLPQKSLKTLYYSLFHYHLIYAIEIWSSPPPSILQPLISKQKSAIRIITNKKYNNQTEPLFKQLSILPPTDLITLSNLKFFHSFYIDIFPLLSLILGKRSVMSVTTPIIIFAMTMNTMSLITELARMPLFNLPRIWNLHSPELTDSPVKHIYARPSLLISYTI
jgi:hypothetical protein